MIYGGNNRVHARIRKYVRAMLPLEAKGLISNFEYYPRFIPKKNSVEFTGEFLFNGRPMRHDFEMLIDEPMPSVESIRKSFWEGLKSV